MTNEFINDHARLTCMGGHVRAVHCAAGTSRAFFISNRWDAATSCQTMPGIGRHGPNIGEPCPDFPGKPYREKRGTYGKGYKTA